MKYKFFSDVYQKLVQESKHYFNKADTSIWDKRNKIKVIIFEEKEITIKFFKIPHFINKVVYAFFRDSKAKKSYENSLKIIDFVPQPIGYTEFFKFGLFDESYFLCEKFEYDFTIREVLLGEDFQDRENILQAFAFFTYQLHEKKIEHLDYSPGNILIKKVDDNYVFKLVDINRMQFKELSIRERLKNFSKLWAKDEDLMMIIKAYALLVEEDEISCVAMALKYSQRHKKRKNFKKRLKREKVVD